MHFVSLRAVSEQGHGVRRFVLVDDAFKRPLAPIRKRLPGDRASGTEPPRDFACGVDGESVEPCAVRQRVTGAGTGDERGKLGERVVVPCQPEYLVPS